MTDLEEDRPCVDIGQLRDWIEAGAANLQRARGRIQSLYPHLHISQVEETAIIRAVLSTSPPTQVHIPSFLAGYRRQRSKAS